MLHEMRLVGLAMDPFSNSPIVILKDKASADAEEKAKQQNPEKPPEEAIILNEHILPIWIGETEANAIATELLGIAPSRPMTHDLIKEVINLTGGQVQRVIVTDLKENTFYAVIELHLHNGEIVSLDSRPSDALALALRCKANIFVDSKVLEKTHSSEATAAMPEQELNDSNRDKWKNAVESASVDSLNKYRQ